MTASLPPAHLPAETPGPERRRMLVIGGVVAGIIVLLLVGGGVVLAYRLLLGHEDRATAAYAPPDSVVYVAANTDPTSRAWLDAWRLARRAGIDDELTRLPEDGLTEAGEDPSLWDELIRPAIGREVGLAVWQPAGQGSADVALIVMVADEDAATRAIDRVLEGQAPESRTYRDVTYQVGDNDNAVGIVDEALVVATGGDAIERVIDARRDGALDGVDRFSEAASRSDDDPLVFAYADGSAIATLARSSAGAAAGIGLDDAALESYDTASRITFTIRAKGDGLRFVALTDGRPAGFPAGPAGDPLADDMPASTIVYLAGVDLYDAIWRPAVEQAEAMSNALESGGAPSTDRLGSLGIGADDPLLAHLTGPYSLFVAAQSDDSSPFGASSELRFSSQLDDPAAVQAAVDDLATTLQEIGVPLTRGVDGFSASGSGVPAFADVRVDDGLLVSVRLGDPLGGGTLAGDEGFAALMGDVPDDASMIGYLALDRLIGLVPEDEWGDVSPAARATLEALGPLGWSITADGDGLRSEIVLLVPE